MAMAIHVKASTLVDPLIDPEVGPSSSRHDRLSSFSIRTHTNDCLFCLNVDDLNIDRPWSWKIYFDSIRGVENFQVYFWIAKDLAWSQNWTKTAIVCGAFALFWNAIILYHGVSMGNVEETYMVVGAVLWLTANFTWMFGEVMYESDDTVYSPDAHIVFITALAWVGLYYVVLRPCKLIKTDLSMKADYEYIGLRPRFSYFEHWRQYEHVHTLFWLGKDFAWNAQNPVMWVIFVIPTILVALDFIWETFRARDMMVDCVHYVAVLIWVMGNFTWAVGELFVSSHDDYPYSMWDTSEAARGQLRWWAAWVMFSAYIPIVLLYAVWLPLTYTGALDDKDVSVHGRLGRLSHSLGTISPTHLMGYEPVGFIEDFDYSGSLKMKVDNRDKARDEIRAFSDGPIGCNMTQSEHTSANSEVIVKEKACESSADDDEHATPATAASPEDTCSNTSDIGDMEDRDELDNNNEGVCSAKMSACGANNCTSGARNQNS